MTSQPVTVTGNESNNLPEFGIDCEIFELEKEIGLYFSELITLPPENDSYGNGIQNDSSPISGEIVSHNDSTIKIYPKPSPGTDVWLDQKKGAFSSRYCDPEVGINTGGGSPVSTQKYFNVRTGGVKSTANNSSNSSPQSIGTGSPGPQKHAVDHVIAAGHYDNNFNSSRITSVGTVLNASQINNVITSTANYEFAHNRARSDRLQAFLWNRYEAIKNREKHLSNPGALHNEKIQLELLLRDISTKRDRMNELFEERKRVTSGEKLSIFDSSSSLSSPSGGFSATARENAIKNAKHIQLPMTDSVIPFPLADGITDFPAPLYPSGQSRQGKRKKVVTSPGPVGNNVNHGNATGGETEVTTVIGSQEGRSPHNDTSVTRGQIDSTAALSSNYPTQIEGQTGNNAGSGGIGNSLQENGPFPTSDELLKAGYPNLCQLMETARQVDALMDELHDNSDPVPTNKNDPLDQSKPTKTNSSRPSFSQESTNNVVAHMDLNALMSPSSNSNSPTGNNNRTKKRTMQLVTPLVTPGHSQPSSPTSNMISGIKPTIKIDSERGVSLPNTPLKRSPTELKSMMSGGKFTVRALEG